MIHDSQRGRGEGGSKGKRERERERGRGTQVPGREGGEGELGATEI